MKNYQFKKLKFKSFYRTFFIFLFIIEELVYFKGRNEYWQYYYFRGLFFTEWSRLLVIIYFVFQLTNRTKNITNTNLSTLFHTAWTSQAIVFVLYWTLIHRDAKKLINGPYLSIILRTKHSAPFLFINVDFLFNNINLSLSDFRKNFLFVLTYVSLCMIISLTVRPLYPRFTFRDSFTYIVLLFGLFIDVLFWKLGRFLDTKKIIKKTLKNKLFQLYNFVFLLL